MFIFFYGLLDVYDIGRRYLETFKTAVKYQCSS